MTGFALILASLMYIILDFDMMMRGIGRSGYREWSALPPEPDIEPGTTKPPLCAISGD